MSYVQKDTSVSAAWDSIHTLETSRLARYASRRFAYHTMVFIGVTEACYKSAKGGSIIKE